MSEAADWLAQWWGLLAKTAGYDDDTIQEAALKIWLSWDSFQAPERAAPSATQRLRVGLAHRITRNQRVDDLRKRAVRVKYEQGLLADHVADVERLVLLREDLRATWAQLSDDERRAVALLAAGYTQEETAQRCGTIRASLKTRLFRMRQRLHTAA